MPVIEEIPPELRKQSYSHPKSYSQPKRDRQRNNNYHPKPDSEALPAQCDRQPKRDRQRNSTSVLPLWQESDRPNTLDLVHIYLKEIARVPLLTPEQEIGYGKQVQQMMPLLEAKDSLERKLRREPTVKEWAVYVQLGETELTAIVQRGQRARDRMVKANLRLVVSVAKMYQKRGLELLDLIQEGSIGLQRGAEKFDPSKGYKFSTYAYWWIKQGITRAIAQQGRTIRLPIHIIEKLNKIKKVQRQLSQKLGRTPTLTAVAAELKMTPKQVREFLEQARLPVSLDLRVGDDHDTELGDFLEDPNADSEKLSIQLDLVDNLDILLTELTPQQREVLNLRFGLLDGQVLTLAKVGKSRGLSRERVRQLETAAIKRIRRDAKAEAVLHDYL